MGVDIGGTHFEVGITDTSGSLLESKSNSWDSLTLTPEQAILLISEAAKTLLASLSSRSTDPVVLCAAGIGCPGWSKDNILVAASNFPLFSNAPLASMLSKALGGIPAVLVNDADAFACAEVLGNPAVYKHARNVALITLGTGIGFGLILNGQLHQGSHGLLEAGHMIVTTVPGARKCGCGQVGCVETYSSASNTALRLEELDKADSSSSEKLTGKDVFARYATNDFNAVTVVEETAEHLAVMVINVCRVVDPDVIVFGGGLARAGETLLSCIRKYIAKKSWTVLPTEVELVTARSDNAGVIGPALAAQQQVLQFTPLSTSLAPSTAPLASPFPRPALSLPWRLLLGASGIVLTVLHGRRLREGGGLGALHVGLGLALIAHELQEWL